MVVEEVVVEVVVDDCVVVVDDCVVIVDDGVVVVDESVAEIFSIGCELSTP